LPDDPKQIDLRRAVSAAYYALFHLLTTEAAQNWKNESQRTQFARMFDHRRMRASSSKISLRLLPADPAEIPSADYDNSKVWSRTQVYDIIAQTQYAMAAWNVVREKDLAQDYLFDLMGSRS
jgi:uncharacterized protein (UPF0332 family)